MGTGLIDFLCEECGCFFRIPFPFSPFLFADCGFPHKDILYYLSLGLFTILHGKSTPIYGLFHPLLDILRLDFLLCVLVLNIAVWFSFWILVHRPLSLACVTPSFTFIEVYHLFPVSCYNFIIASHIGGATEELPAVFLRDRFRFLKQVPGQIIPVVRKHCSAKR